MKTSALCAKRAAKIQPCCSRLFVSLFMFLMLLLPVKVWGFDHQNPDRLYLIGEAIPGVGWSNDYAVPMQKTANGKFTVRVVLNKQNALLKFLTQRGNWNGVYAATNNNEIINVGGKNTLVPHDGTNDNNFKLQEDYSGKAIYQIDVDVTNSGDRHMSVKWIKDWSGSTWNIIYIVGSAVNNNHDWQAWDDVQYMTPVDNGVFTWTGELKAHSGDVNNRRFKFISKQTWDGNQSRQYFATIADVDIKDGINPSQSNISTDGTDDRKFVVGETKTYTIKVDLNTNKMWVDIPTPTLTSNYYLRGDLWMNSSGWIHADQIAELPKLVKSDDGTSASVTVLMPNFKGRVKWVKDGSSEASSNFEYATLGATKSVTYTITKSGNTELLEKTVTDYTVKKDGWKLYVDGNLEGITDANGEVIVSNLEGEHLFYFTDGSAAADLRWGVNKFGGLYVDQTNSDGSLLSLKQYYKQSSIGTFTAPISNDYDAKNGYWNATGLINLTTNSDVKFTFDGGKITINKVAASVLTGNWEVKGTCSDDAQNWVSGWSTTPMTITNGVASKKFENVSGSWLMFTVVNEDGSEEHKWADFDGSASSGANFYGDDVIGINQTQGNIENSDITVNYDGTKVWAVVERYYNVTINKNNGSDSEVLRIKSGQKVTTQATPEKSGYTFIGWTKDEVAYDFNSSVTGDITLQANWKCNTISGKFQVVGVRQNNDASINWPQEGFTNSYTEIADHQMTITDGVARKTFYNVKFTDNVTFRVVKIGEDSESDTWINALNLIPSSVLQGNATLRDYTAEPNHHVRLGDMDRNKHYDITICVAPGLNDSYEMWAEVRARQTFNTNYCLSGDFNGWDNSALKLTKVDDYEATITRLFTPQIYNGYTSCDEGKTQRVKVVVDGSWDNQLTKSYIHEASSDYVEGDDGCDADGKNPRMVVKIEQPTNITFTVWKDHNGQKQVTIKAVPVEIRTVIFHDGAIEKQVQVEVGNRVVAPSFERRGADLDWYSDENCTQLFDFNTAITEDMTLYSKAKNITGTYYIRGNVWHNWTTEDRTPKIEAADGKFTYTYIAPIGRNDVRFLKGGRGDENIIDARYLDTENSSAGINISDDNNHIFFTVADKPQQVTVTFDGAIKVTMQDYTPHYVDGLYMTANSSGWANVWQSNGTKQDISGSGVRESNKLRRRGEEAQSYIILRDVKTGTYDWKLYSSNGDAGCSGKELFNAPYVDYTCTSANGNWHWNRTDCASWSEQLSYENNDWRNVRIVVDRQCQLKVVFDGALIKVMDLPQYTVTFNTNGGTAVAAKTVYEEERVTEPTTKPGKPLYKFVKWQLNGVDFDFANTPITDNITLDAVYELASYSLHGPLWRVSDSNNDFGTEGSPAFTNDGEKATVSLVAPKGRQTFGILRDRSYDHQIKPTCDTEHSSGIGNLNRDSETMWFHFELEEASYITITYTAQNKVYVTVDPTYEKMDGTFYLFNYPNPKDKTQLVNGELILRDLPTSDKDFKITTESGDEGAVNGVTRFGGPYVEYEGESGLWATHTYRHDWQYGDQERAFPIVGRENDKKDDWADKYWQNAHVHIPNHQLINGKADLRFTFDGKTIRVNFVEHVSVTCKLAADGETFATQSAFKGNIAVAPETTPEPRAADRAAFVEWRKEGETVAFNWSTPITEDITLVAFWDVLQDRVDEVEDGGIFTLTHDYSGGELIVDKNLTINGNGYTIGNLTVTETGNLNVNGELKVANLYIKAAPAEPRSAQIFNADNLKVQGDAYIDIKFADAISYGWYALAVPFEVDLANGIYTTAGQQLVNERDYAVMQYQGDVRAQGKYGWIKVHKTGARTLRPGVFYLITIDDEHAADYATLRFKKVATSPLNNMGEVAMAEYALNGGATGDEGWNGLANPGLTYANASSTVASLVQSYSHETNSFSTFDMSAKSFVVTSSFFVQATNDGAMLFSEAAAPLSLQAPRRAPKQVDRFAVRLAEQGKEYQDQLFVSASEDAEATYQTGRDLCKASMGEAKVAQLSVSGYGLNLTAADFPLQNGEAEFPLVMTAPAAGDYELSLNGEPNNGVVYLLANGRLVWNLSMSDYSLHLDKGTNTSYSLKVVGISNVATDLNEGGASTTAEKVLLNGSIYILRGQKMYDATGKMLK